MYKERMLNKACSVPLLACVNVGWSKINQSGSREQLSPAFSDSARKLWAAIDQERQNLGGSDADQLLKCGHSTRVVEKTVGANFARAFYEIWTT